MSSSPKFISTRSDRKRLRSEIEDPTVRSDQSPKRASIPRYIYKLLFTTFLCRAETVRFFEDRVVRFYLVEKNRKRSLRGCRT